MICPPFGYDERTLREVVIDVDELKVYVSGLDGELAQAVDPEKQVSLLGEIGTHLRSLGDLKQAEVTLRHALLLIEDHKLGSRREAQQKIRLAHVYQWQKDFKQSNSLFDEVILLCRLDPEAQFYLDFALQHAGKSFFDQQEFEKALACFNEALELRVKKGSPADQLSSTQNAIAETQRRLTRR